VSQETFNVEQWKREMDDRADMQTRVVRLEENQEHFSKQVDALTVTVNTRFSNIEHSLSTLVTQISNRGKISWPLIISCLGVFLSCVMFTTAMVTSYVSLRVTPIEIETGYIKELKAEVDSLKIEAAVQQRESAYRDAAFNHVWQKTHSSASADKGILPQPR
jgi:hypothetical protein